MITRPFVKYGLTTAGLAGVSLAAYDPSLFKRVSRPVIFWKGMFPIYLKYRWTEWQLKDLSPEERKIEFEKLHREYAPKVLDIILNLRGIYIKVGQTGAARPDILPDIYRKQFRVLLDQVPPLPEDQIRPIVEKAIGMPIEDMFSEFDTKALGAASIGQVHKAKLKSNGQDVVVKVKYPDSEFLFSSDMKVLKQFCRIAQPEQMIAMNEFESQFMKEVDFSSEGRALERVSSTVMPKFKNVVIPRPVFYNRDVVVMEYLPGVKLIDAVLEEHESFAKRMGLTLEQLQSLNGKPKSSPSIWDRIGYSAYQWSKSINYYSQCALTFLLNISIGWAAGYAKYPRPPIRPKEIFKTVVDVHGYELFQDGFFNGDPHPGNILYLDDGRLGLIDYGQVKELTELERTNLAKFVLAVAARDRDAVVDMMRKGGHKTKYQDDQVAWELAMLMYDRDDPEALGGLSFQQKLEELDKRDPAISTTDTYIFVGRVSVLLRGLAALLSQDPMSTAQSWKPFAEKCLKEFNSKPSE